MKNIIVIIIVILISSSNSYCQLIKIEIGTTLIYYDIRKGHSVESHYLENGMYNVGPRKNILKSNLLANKLQPNNKDYKSNFIYDRGHLIPANKILVPPGHNIIDTFINIVPQLMVNNRGIWFLIENEIRNIQEQCNCNIKVISSTFGELVKLNNRVIVPKVMFKFIKYNSNIVVWRVRNDTIQNGLISNYTVPYNDYKNILKKNLD